MNYSAFYIYVQNYEMRKQSKYWFVSNGIIDLL
jgi:hypothetical protein